MRLKYKIEVNKEGFGKRQGDIATLCLMCLKCKVGIGEAGGK